MGFSIQGNSNVAAQSYAPPADESSPFDVIGDFFADVGEGFADAGEGIVDTAIWAGNKFEDAAVTAWNGTKDGISWYANHVKESAVGDGFSKAADWVGDLFS